MCSQEFEYIKYNSSYKSVACIYLIRFNSIPISLILNERISAISRFNKTLAISLTIEI
jgi:hypothetical protein